jgi:hypothetical protein
MKKFISLSIALFCFTSFIESCQPKKTPQATHALYSETILFLSSLSTTKRTETVKITDLIGKKALVFTRSELTKVQRGGLIDIERSTKQLEAILYSDGSQEPIENAHHHENEFVAIWPFPKGDLIIFRSTSK